jgi:hypothetical protein
MFNWLFGKYYDTAKNGELVEVAPTVEQEAVEDEKERRMFQEYGDKRSYTFPDGKILTWDVEIGFDFKGRKAVIESRKNEFWWLNYPLKDLPELSPPASQLFLILLNDQRNIKYTEEGDFFSPKRVYTHSKLGIVYQEFAGGSLIEGLNSIDSKDITNIKDLFCVYNTTFNLTSRRERYRLAMKKRTKSLETRKLDAYLKTITK